MNKVRRKELQELYDIISEAKDRLEMLHDEEEEYKDNMPENLQSSERYEKAEAAETLSALPCPLLRRYSTT